MNPASQPSREWLALPAEERARTFQAKPVWQRFLIVLAGPMTNFLFAIAHPDRLPHRLWRSRDTPPVVGGAARARPPRQAGLRTGDRIVAIDGAGIDRFEDIAPARRPSSRTSRCQVSFDAGRARLAAVDARPQAASGEATSSATSSAAASSASVRAEQPVIDAGAADRGGRRRGPARSGTSSRRRSRASARSSPAAARSRSLAGRSRSPNSRASRPASGRSPSSGSSR